MIIDATDRLRVIDGTVGRLTVIAPSGTVESSLITRVASRIDAILPLGADMIAVTDDSANNLVRLNRDGHIISRSDFPWRPFSQIPVLARQGIAVSRLLDSTWAFGFGMGNGFFVFDGLTVRPYVGTYAEPLAFPDVVRTIRNKTVRNKLSRRVTTAIAMTMTNTELLVLYGGSDNTMSGRLIDRFRLVDGRYVGSYRLQQRTSSIALRTNGDLVTLSDDGLFMYKLH
jgi:hypothetical protein